MPYKMVIDIGKLCGSLAGAAVRHRELISADMADMLRDAMEDGQEFPNIHQIQTSVADDLHKIYTQLLESSREVNEELTDIRRGRLERDQASSETREQLFAARQILNVVFGPGGASAFFQEPNAKLPLRPAAVHEQAMVVSGKLLDEDFVPPPVRYEVGVDLRAIGRKLREPAERLGAALAKLDLGLHGKNQPLEAKERLFAQLQKRALQGAQLLEAIYNYSGHEGIASRTRRSRHRLRRKVVVAEPAPPAGGGPEPWSAASRARSPAVPATMAGRSPPDHERRASAGGVRRAPIPRPSSSAI